MATQPPELTAEQERAKLKVEHLSQDPNAAPRDMASAKAAEQFNDRANGVEPAKQKQSEVSGQQGKGAANDNAAKQEQGTKQDKPQPVQKPESQRGKDNTAAAHMARVLSLAKTMTKDLDKSREQEQDRGPSMGR